MKKITLEELKKIELELLIKVDDICKQEKIRYSVSATVVARALGIKVIGLTGARVGELDSVADVVVKVPETETYKIQELHLPIYHCWCMMLEDRFFGA